MFTHNFLFGQNEREKRLIFGDDGEALKQQSASPNTEPSEPQETAQADTTEKVEQQAAELRKEAGTNSESMQNEVREITKKAGWDQIGKFFEKLLSLFSQNENEKSPDLRGGIFSVRDRTDFTKKNPEIKKYIGNSQLTLTNKNIETSPSDAPKSAPARINTLPAGEPIYIENLHEFEKHGIRQENGEVPNPSILAAYNHLMGMGAMQLGERYAPISQSANVNMNSRASLFDETPQAPPKFVFRVGTNRAPDGSDYLVLRRYPTLPNGQEHKFNDRMGWDKEFIITDDDSNTFGTPLSVKQERTQKREEAEEREKQQKAKQSREMYERGVALGLGKQPGQMSKKERQQYLNVTMRQRDDANTATFLTGLDENGRKLTDAEQKEENEKYYAESEYHRTNYKDRTGMDQKEANRKLEVDNKRIIGEEVRKAFSQIYNHFASSKHHSVETDVSGADLGQGEVRLIYHRQGDAKENDVMSAVAQTLQINRSPNGKVEYKVIDHVSGENTKSIKSPVSTFDTAEDAIQKIFRP